MTRFLLFFVMVICQNGAFGKHVYGNLPSNNQLEFSVYPLSEAEAERQSHHMTRDIDAQNSAEHASLCYFVQESEIESQISCRLRFTRSKFNFNPFGLRFGKRGQSSSSNRNPVLVSRKLIPQYLLKLKESRMLECEDSSDYC
nr:PREDICTED: uncharacterized protein LOC106704023 [Latimeria chalumnae]|eukprot:XP_014345641.1 PREDICTED: uncharacterized protein LOC106704023 [Latimeria chalumnae]